MNLTANVCTEPSTSVSSNTRQVPDQDFDVFHTYTYCSSSASYVSASGRSCGSSPGYTYKEIARRLSLSVQTVETHVSGVLRRLQLSSRHELTRWATDRRLI